MGISSDPPSDESKTDSKPDPKHEVVMGYPQPSSSPYPPSCAPFPYPYPHGYPSSSFQPHHGYPQPYNDYCYQQQYYRVQESRNNAVFGRVVLILMIVFITSMCMMSMVVWFLFGSYIPEFGVGSVRVLNFTATNTALAGVWSVEMSVSNYNKDLDINFYHGVSSIFYKDAMLGISPLNPFKVEKIQQLNMSFNTPAVDEKLQGWVLPTLAQDRSNGAVVFDLRLAADANFTATNAVYRQERLRVLCRVCKSAFLRPPEKELCRRIHPALVWFVCTIPWLKVLSPF